MKEGIRTGKGHLAQLGSVHSKQEFHMAVEFKEKTCFPSSYKHIN